MTGWLKLTDEQRRETLTQSQQRTGIIVKAIEKDWWVTLTLKALFQSAYKNYIVFKGGTSLSKCWKLIARFSEDVDIALDPEAFEMKYEENPSRSYVKKLKRKGCEFTSTKLKGEIEKQLAALGIPAGTVIIEAAPVPEDFPDTDPQTLFVKYKSLYDPIEYIADEVKIEVSVRSLKVPFTTRPVQSILNEVFPNPVYNETPFPVSVVEPRKTFLEKAFLLHEEFLKPEKSKIKGERMSRHPYDLVSMMNTEIGPAALTDHNLYDHLIIHRKWYTGFAWVDYESLGHSTISFVPSAEVLEIYRNDYETMKEQMIYEEAMDFDDLIEQLKILQGRFRIKTEVKPLEEFINEALNNLQEFIKENPDATSFETKVTYSSDPYKPLSPANNTIMYTVQFTRKGNKIVFESIKVHEN